MPIDLRGHPVLALLDVRHVEAHEAISTPFEVLTVAVSRSPDIDVRGLIWTPAELLLRAGWAHVEGGGARLWSGYIEHCGLVAVEPTGLSTYVLKVVPRLAMLGHNRDRRVFHRQTAPQIIGSVLGEWGIEHEWRVDRGLFPVLEYRVQYDESDLAFVNRQCEENGLSYLFEPRQEGAAMLVFTDDPAMGPLRPAAIPFDAEPNMSAEREFLTALQLAQQAGPVTVIVRDKDFRNPARFVESSAQLDAPPSARAAKFEAHVGSTRIHTWHPPADGSPPAGRGERHDVRAAAQLAENIALADAAHAFTITGETNVLGLYPGQVFSVDNHPHPALAPERRLLVTAYDFKADHDKEWRPSITAASADAPFKPLRKTPRPHVYGIQSAEIVGPEGSETHVDVHGRVLARFPWNRAEGESSCWMRVSRSYTAPGSGMHVTPRVGTEVLVQFFDGNPDEPVVVGCVANALTPPPHPFPSAASKAVFHAHSTPDGGERHTELTVETQKGKELVYLHAPKDMRTNVGERVEQIIGTDARRLIRGDDHAVVQGERREQTDGDVHAITGGSVYSETGGDASHRVGGDVNIEANGTLSIVADAIYLRARSSIFIEGMDGTFRSEGSFLRVGPGAVLASPFIPNAGAPGVGAPSSPSPPKAPVTPATFVATPPKAITRTPLIGMPPLKVPPQSAEEIVCPHLCQCNELADEKAAEGGRRAAQTCLSKRLKDYDRALGFKSTIKAEVPFDMNEKPPAPYMSKNEPMRATGRRPAGSQIPDFIEVWDGSLPARGENIRRIVEVKFGKQRLQDNQVEIYPDIAPGVPYQVWGTDWPCYCKDRRRKVPERLYAPSNLKQRAKDREKEKERQEREHGELEALAALALLLAEILVLVLSRGAVRPVRPAF
jgi:type VI secretion system secreted protein VgrG